MLNIKQLAEELTPVQFEQLLRLCLQAEFDRLPNKQQMIMLIAGTGYDKNTEMTSCRWQVGYSSDTHTKGEVLSDIVTEHNRRLDFDKSAKLQLLEYQGENKEEAELQTPMS